MLENPDKELRRNRKKPLFDSTSIATPVDFPKTDIERIIPHRDPLLFVDHIDGLDIDEGLISGSRTLDPSDPIFKGHFPEVPLYPGNFTLEMIGQLGLCLFYFDQNKTTSIAPDATPVPARATRIMGAYYLEPIPPGAKVQLLAKKIDFDGYFASMIGQALVDGKVAVVTIGEVIIMAEE